MKKKMFYGASHLMFARAKQLRNNLTDAESHLWNYLRTKPYGYKFRRQHPIGLYIADFYCHQLKLIIEVDGLIHDREEIQKSDLQRTQILESAGIKIVRIANDEIVKHGEIAIARINNLLNQI
jgi:cyclase